ncbi:MAG: hypothetical protein U0X93_17915 [Anaerolineales bacterium]
MTLNLCLQAQIALAEVMAESTLAPLAAVVGLFLPVGLGSQQVDAWSDLRLPIQRFTIRREGEISPKRLND